MGLTASKEVKKPKSKKDDKKKKLPKVAVKGKKPVKGKKMKGGDKCSSTFCPNCNSDQSMTGVTNTNGIIGYKCPNCKQICSVDA